jgi:hypothetical protein
MPMPKIKFAFFFTTLMIYFCESNATTNQLEELKGAKTKITLENWSTFANAWQKITFSNMQTRFQIYNTDLLENSENIDHTKNFFSTFSESLSPSKKFMVLQRSEIGTLLLGNGSAKATEVSHCEFIDMNNGCVMQSLAAGYCSGKWAPNDEWINLSVGNSPRLPAFETPSPGKIKEEISEISDIRDKASIIQDYMYMGPSSYLACFPPSTKNITNLNDIAYFLAESGKNAEALEIYKALEKISPSRMVLKLNIADALWADDNRNEAKLYYFQYKELMIESGLIKKIPTRVFDRTNKP